MKTNEPSTSAFSLVLEAETDVFSDLVELSGLRPQSDFQGSRLAGVDFENSDLENFNFDYADLRGALWRNRTSDPDSLRYSLRGHGTDEVRGGDFKDISEKFLSNSLWAERFYAFRILVDNWGENSDTAEVLSRLLQTEAGTYLPLCSYVYFTASYLNDSEAKTLCVDMANAGSSQINIFRLKKLRRLAISNAKHLDSTELNSRYPGDLKKSDLESVQHRLSNTLRTPIQEETPDT